MQKTGFKRYAALVVLSALALTAAGCSSDKGMKASAASPEQQIYDPFEGANRSILKVNEGIDKAVIEPTARGYRYVTPKPIRTGIRNFLRNLKSPIVMGNELLQGDMEGFANASGRLVINTLLGVGGLFDVADMGGIPYEPEDFGQTLAVWGVPNGPYLMIPLLGPSTARDGTGLLVDSLLDPVRIYLYNHDLEWLDYTRVAVGLIDQREQLLEVIDDLRRNSFDYYAALRSAYYQRRAAMINDMDPASAAGPEIPNYDQ